MLLVFHNSQIDFIMDKLGVGKLVDLAGSVITGVMGGLEQLFGPALQNGPCMMILRRTFVD